MFTKFTKNKRSWEKQYNSFSSIHSQNVCSFKSRSTDRHVFCTAYVYYIQRHWYVGYYMIFLNTERKADKWIPFCAQCFDYKHNFDLSKNQKKVENFVSLILIFDINHPELLQSGTAWIAVTVKVYRDSAKYSDFQHIRR